MDHGRIITVWIALNLFYCSTSALFNAALGKKCTQSSTQNWKGPGNAVDGIIDFMVTCTRTRDNLMDPWWQVDLAGVYWIQSVLIRNRKKDPDLLSNFTVSVLLDNENQEAVCTFYQGAMPSGAIETLPCHHNLLGRFVKISKTSPVLPLCEVQVLVVDKPNAKVLFERQIDKTIVDESDAEMVVADAPSCAEYCKRSMSCYAFGHNPITGTCRQYSTTVMSSTTSDKSIFYIRRN